MNNTEQFLGVMRALLPQWLNDKTKGCNLIASYSLIYFHPVTAQFEIHPLQKEAYHCLCRTERGANCLKFWLFFAMEVNLLLQ